MLSQKELAKEYEQDMQLLVDSGGGEENHMQADAILCDLLKYLGYIKLVEIYNSVNKWYA
jgi:hypothetical protein